MSNTTKRSNAGRTKYGSKANGTDGAHKTSYEVHNAIAASKPGRKTTDHRAVNRDLNSNSNIRIKSVSGNRSTDRINDAKIISSIQNGTLPRGAVAERAKQAYKGTLDATSPSVQRTNEIIGNMTVDTGKRGPKPKIKNL